MPVDGAGSGRGWLPGSGGTLILVGETGQVLSDCGSTLWPAVMQRILLWTIFCSEQQQKTPVKYQKGFKLLLKLSGFLPQSSTR